MTAPPAAGNPAGRRTDTNNGDTQQQETSQSAAGRRAHTSPARRLNIHNRAVEGIAACRNRTDDLRITREPLRLSRPSWNLRWRCPT